MNHLPFIAAAAFLTLAVVLWLLYPLLRRAQDERTAARRALNVAIYRDELQELEHEQQDGSLAAADYQQARDELQQRLLEDVQPTEQATRRNLPSWRSAVLLALLLPASAAGLYFWLGQPAALNPAPAEAGISPAQVEDMVAKLAAHMEQHPDDLQGWKMLARSSKVLRHFDQSAQAFEKVLALGGDQDPDQLAEYADVLIAQSGEQYNKRAQTLLEQALQLEPDHMMALALAGSIAYAQDDYAAALKHWHRLQQLLPADTDESRSLAEALQNIRSKAATGNRPTQDKPADSDTTGTAVANSIQGQVSLAPALRGQVKPNEVLYISAHAINGPRMPLAVLRAQVADLPLSFTLDDSLALDPQLKLSSAAEVQIEARISKSGDARPRKGDLQGKPAQARLGSKNVQLLIDQVLP